MYPGTCLKILTLFSLPCFLVVGLMWLFINKANVNTDLMLQDITTARVEIIGDAPAKKWRHRVHDEELNTTKISTPKTLFKLATFSSKFTFY